MGTALIVLGLSLPAPAQERAHPEPQMLPPVAVTGEREGGVPATSTRVGKVLQDPHEVARAVTTINDSLMQEQQVNSLRVALRNVPGLTFNAAEARSRLRAFGTAPAARVARTDGSSRR